MPSTPSLKLPVSLHLFNGQSRFSMARFKAVHLLHALDGNVHIFGIEFDHIGAARGALPDALRPAWSLNPQKDLGCN